MGACDLVLVHAPNFHKDAMLDIHIRTTTRYDYSYIESAAIQIGNDIFEVDSFGQHFLNGVADAKMPATIFGFPVTRTQKDLKSIIYEVSITGGEKIILNVFKDWVSVSIKNVNSHHFIGSYGMMGDMETGLMFARDGNTVLTDPSEFGNEWQVRDDEAMLFQFVREPQYPNICQLPNPASAKNRRLGGIEVSYDDAKEACARSHFDNASLEACIHDVIAVGDLDLAYANAGAF